MTASPYKDRRSEFFRTYFEKGLPYSDYVKTGTEAHQAKWKTFEERLSLSSEQKALLGSFSRDMNIIVMSGTWCGDCARQGPMLYAIEQAAPRLKFRYLDNKENPELQDELRINGAEKVPVVVVLSEDFFELERFGDRHLSVYRSKLKSELGAACDAGILPPPGEELAVELQEWINFFERTQILLRLAPMLRRRYGD